jgi:hypothetical protein
MPFLARLASLPDPLSCRTLSHPFPTHQAHDLLHENRGIRQRLERRNVLLVRQTLQPLPPRPETDTSEIER